MKKILLIILTIILIITLTGCNNKENSQNEENANNVLDTNNQNANKILVVYFSKTGENYNVGKVEVGNTAMMASYIKEYLKADSYEIVPTIKYPDEYTDVTEVAKKEQKENSRPEIKNELTNLSDYDTIFIGYPIWWGDLPMIVYTFLESYDFSNKTLIPFNTHEGSGESGTYNKIKEKLTNSNVNTNGLAIQGSVARTEEGKNKTINWLKELGY